MSSSIYSVIIPAYNAERYLAETIQSVLAQTVPPKEIVVVDDGSSDATATVAEQQGPLIRVIRTENRGSGSATSTGIRATTTDIFATVDSDDIWLPNKMEAQLALLNDPARQLDAVLSRMAPFGETEKRTAPVETEVVLLFRTGLRLG
ncbi:glycosyltransferase family 2 protein [Shimia litoralis]|uniref:Glycosyltransferase family 2 protein n=1 Tax=Shimia litoralis TaxID=420403 RepID=A0A4U7MR81_9RHOB|nr:glycosyltransferase family 2 protein [Shimia litoralis]TKZ15452.1 glycosyltransferase family 2 protein [Shimia litoralis]